jgi:hypothetical protein
MDDSVRISKIPLSNLSIAESVNKDSSATMQEQKKIQTGIAGSTDSFEIAKGDRHFSLDAEKGQVTFGDGIKGKTPGTGNSSVQVNYNFGLGKSGNIITGREHIQIEIGTRAAGLKNAGGSMDPNELVKRVLHEAYDQATEDLNPYSKTGLQLTETKQAAHLETSDNWTHVKKKKDD